MIPTATSLLTRRVSVVTAVDPESVASRTATLVRTGTNPLIAKQIAEQADEQQELRDARVKQEIEIKTEALTASVASTKLTDTHAPASNPPAAVPTHTTPVEPPWDELTVEGLRAHAAEHKLEIASSLRTKAEILAAVRDAHFTKYPVAS